MAKPNITARNHMHGDIPCKLVTFNIPGGVTTPEEFVQAVAEIEAHLTGKLPVFISGRGPIWGFAMLVHAAHATPAVATFDPRLGYVVIQSHTKLFAVGDVIPLEAQA